ncbi:MAG: hypothetical protein SVQ76_00500 [Candidatus Nanohaloarchaea archaeon]|nr:hypothetical protein [Candidatus Nanohaloarchaea archaeon]
MKTFLVNRGKAAGALFRVSRNSRPRAGSGTILNRFKEGRP